MFSVLDACESVSIICTECRAFPIRSLGGVPRSCQDASYLAVKRNNLAGTVSATSCFDAYGLHYPTTNLDPFLCFSAWISYGLAPFFLQFARISSRCPRLRQVSSARATVFEAAFPPFGLGQMAEPRCLVFWDCLALALLPTWQKAQNRIPTLVFPEVFVRHSAFIGR